MLVFVNWDKHYLEFLDLYYSTTSHLDWFKFLLWIQLKGCGMGPLLVLVFLCFRKNVVVTCKIGPFLCSLDNLLQKKCNCCLFWRSNFKMALIWKKRVIFDLLFTFFSYQGIVTKFLWHISHSNTCILLTLLTFFFFALPILKKYELIRYGFSLVWFLVLIRIRAIWNNQ